MTSRSDHNSYNDAVAAFAAGRLSKREFMVCATALGFVGAPIGVVGRAEAQTPKRGGTMRIGTRHGQTTDTLDPALLFNGAQWMLGYGVRNTLTQVGASGGLARCGACGNVMPCVGGHGVCGRWPVA